MVKDIEPRREIVPGDVSHIATIQTNGWIAHEVDQDRVSQTKGFTNKEDAIAWVDNHIFQLHGGDIQFEEHTMQYNESVGKIYILRTVEGPSWGWIVSTELSL